MAMIASAVEQLCEERTRHMELKMDADLAAVASFMQTTPPAAKLVSVAQVSASWRPRFGNATTENHQPAGAFD
jgi:hypothetical protein